MFTYKNPGDNDNIFYSIDTLTVCLVIVLVWYVEHIVK